MLSSLSIIICLLCVGDTLLASSPTYRFNVHIRATMQTEANIETFVKSLQLASSPAQALVSKLRAAEDGNGKTTLNAIGLACLVAQATLEAGSVEITPVNQTEVDSNWSVALRVPNFRAIILTTLIKVRIMLGNSVMRAASSIDFGGIQGPTDCHLQPSKILYP